MSSGITRLCGTRSLSMKLKAPGIGWPLHKGLSPGFPSPCATDSTQPGTAVPFLGLFPKQDSVSVVLNSGYTLTSHEEFGKITMKPQCWGGCVPLVKSRGLQSVFSKSSWGQPQLRRAHLTGFEGFLPVTGHWCQSHGEGAPKTEHAAFRDSEFLLAENSQAKTTFSG